MKLWFWRKGELPPVVEPEPDMRTWLHLRIDAICDDGEVDAEYSTLGEIGHILHVRSRGPHWRANRQGAEEEAARG